jgi:quinol---cytochrome c reductase iron-sulfur subunit, bacillus type
VEGSAPTLWPLAFAVGIAVLLVGLIISPVVAVVGAVIAVVAGFAWVRGGGSRRRRASRERKAPAGPRADSMARSTFLGKATLALGGLIGAVIAVPVAGFALLPSFERTRRAPVDVGPFSDFPEGQFVVTTFLLDPAAGEVSRRTAYVRNNGMVGGLPSFTILSSRCTHVGCPTQPNGPIFTEQARKLAASTGPVSLTPTIPAGFGCPCHGSQFDIEGNRTAGPAARALDRYLFSIENGRLLLRETFSVSHVAGTGAQARIFAFAPRGPGQPVTGIESVLYPLQPPN